MGEFVPCPREVPIQDNRRILFHNSEYDQPPAYSATPGYENASPPYQAYQPQNTGFPGQQGYYQQDYPPKSTPVQGQYNPYQGYPPQVQQTHNVTVIRSQPMPQTIVQGSPPPYNMALSIFACLCCFWPLGLVAIYQASQVKDVWYRRDVLAAESKSRSARTLSLAGIVIGIICIVVIVVLRIILINNAEN